MEKAMWQCWTFTDVNKGKAPVLCLHSGKGEKLRFYNVFKHQ